MPYNGEPIRYHYTFFTLPHPWEDLNIMYIKPVKADMALIEYDIKLWNNLIDKAVAQNGDSNSLGILRIHDESYSTSKGQAFEYFLRHLHNYQINEDRSMWQYAIVDHIYSNT